MSLIYLLVGVRIFFLVLQTNVIISSPLNVRIRIEDPYGVNCIMNMVQSSFRGGLLTITSTKNLSYTTYEVQDSLIKWVHNQTIWSIQTVGDFNNNLSEKYVTVPEKYPSINKNNKNWKSNYYIIIIDSLDKFYFKANQIIHSKSFNTKAKYIIYLFYEGRYSQKQAEEMLNYLWRYKIFNAIVVVPDNGFLYHAIYGLYPVDYSDECGQHTEMLHLDRCAYGARKHKYLLFPDKLRNSLNNCTIQVIAIESPPFVISVKNETGFEIKLLEMIGNKLNISFNYTTVKKTEYYLVRNNESVWQGAQKFMKENSAVGIGNMIASGEMYEDFDVTVTYHFEYLRWVVPKADPAPRWKCLFAIFNQKLWIACVTVFFTSSIVFFILAYVNLEIEIYRNFCLSFLNCLRILIGSALHRQPTTQIIRFVFFLTALYGMIVCSLYQSALINVLTNPLFETQIKSQEDILNSRLHIGGTPVYQTIFDNKATENIFSRFETNTSFAYRNVYDWLIRVASVKDYCTVSNLFYVMYVQSNDDAALTNKKGHNQLFITRKNLMSYPVHMVTPKSFPLFNEFNKAIFQVSTGGLTVKWINEIKHLIQLKAKKPSKHDMDGDINLTTAHLEGAFVVVIFGNLLAFITFILELLVHKVVHTRCYNRIRDRCSKCATKRVQKMLPAGRK